MPPRLAPGRWSWWITRADPRQESSQHDAIAAVPEARRPWLSVGTVARPIDGPSSTIPAHLSPAPAAPGRGGASDRRPRSTSSWRPTATSSASSPRWTSTAPTRATPTSPYGSGDATGAAEPRGPFRVGDLVQLTDPKGRHSTFALQPGKDYHSHRGNFSHDDLIGRPEGAVVSQRRGGLPRAAPAAVRLRPVDAARARPWCTRRTPRRSSAWPTSSPAPGSRGRRRVGRAELLAAPRGRRRRAGGVLRAARRLRRDRPQATSSAFFGGAHPAWR